MNKIREFKSAIYFNDFNKVSLLLKDKTFNQFNSLNEDIIEAAGQGYISIVELLLNEPRINITAEQINQAICMASFNGFYEIVTSLLSKKNINPAYDKNYSIIYASYNKHNDVVELLWKYKIVKNTLKNDNIELYNKLIKKDIGSKVREF